MLALNFSVTQCYRHEDEATQEADAEFAGVRDLVLRRDRWTCQACGCYAEFRAYGKRSRCPKKKW